MFLVASQYSQCTVVNYARKKSHLESETYIGSKYQISQAEGIIEIVFELKETARF